MKSLLMLAALLAGLAAPALADDASAPPPPQTQAALSPAQDAATADVLPQSQAGSSDAMSSEPMSAEPMAAPLDANAAPAPRGGGCGHDKSTVYLTN